ncbi:IS30 family transposase [Nitrosomonas communis]|uniref:Integrase core domain-containing protein n=1 Tax=Nitrosomonas communis TaxID=44574 RepID=A0A1I4WH43_9PROT|nr:IS30 family transposase [Nitrosomonas communis]SFN12526.1 hypothetical protein SAMN05421863_11084 [Nitrosomonas communis]
MAERKSRYILAGQLQVKHAEGVTAKISSLLRPHKNKSHTMTFDNRKEFAGHETIAQELEANIYFAHPDHSWERGLNENSKRLLRRYFPKNMKFTDATEEQVSGQSIVSIIDHAKCLDLEPRMKYSSGYG